MPGLFYPIDIDYGEQEAVKSLDSSIKSNLKEPIQNLIKMLFDVDTMKKAMLEFEVCLYNLTFNTNVGYFNYNGQLQLDLEKMPLGKLSRKQIQSAYTVLTEISELIKNGAAEAMFIDASNR